jgi:putative transposase
MKYVAEAVDKFSLTIHAFCLMKNHYHFEIETPRGNLSRAMHWLKTAYAAYFNSRHKRNGHLFQGRFLAALVEKEAHLMALTRYIHLNPVRAGIVERPEEYFWSSYREYIRSGQRWEWLETKWTLHQFGGTNSMGRRYYRQFVEEGIERCSSDLMKESIDGMLLGGDRFIEWAREQIFGRCEDPHDIQQERENRNMKLDEIIKCVGQSMNVSEQTIIARGRHGNDARNLAVYLSHKYSDVTNAMIGKSFGGISGAGVNLIVKEVRNRLKGNQPFRKLLKEIEKNLKFNV